MNTDANVPCENLTGLYARCGAFAGCCKGSGKFLAAGIEGCSGSLWDRIQGIAPRCSWLSFVGLWLRSDGCGFHLTP